MASIRDLFRRRQSEIQRLRERVAYLEGRLAERDERLPRQQPLDEATRRMIDERADEILSGGLQRRAEEAKRDMARRIAYHEIMAERRAAEQQAAES